MARRNRPNLQAQFDARGEFCDPAAAYRNEMYNREVIYGLRQGSMTIVPGSSNVIDCPEEWPAIRARAQAQLPLPRQQNPQRISTNVPALRGAHGTSVAGLLWPGWGPPGSPGDPDLGFRSRRRARRRGQLPLLWGKTEVFRSQFPGRLQTHFLLPSG